MLLLYTLCIGNIGSMNIFHNNIIMSISHIKRDIISNYLDSENSINNFIKTERCPS